MTLLRCLGLLLSCFVLPISASAQAPAAAASPVEGSRANLKALAGAVKAYGLLYNGQRPAKLSALLDEGLVPGANAFVIPGIGHAVPARVEADEKGDYTLEPLPDGADLLVREKIATHTPGKVLAIFRDGSIKALAAPAAPAAGVSAGTNPPALAAPREISPAVPPVNAPAEQRSPPSVRDPAPPTVAQSATPPQSSAPSPNATSIEAPPDIFAVMLETAKRLRAEQEARGAAGAVPPVPVVSEPTTDGSGVFVLQPTPSTSSQPTVSIRTLPADTAERAMSPPPAPPLGSWRTPNAATAPRAVIWNVTHQLIQGMPWPSVKRSEANVLAAVKLNEATPDQRFVNALNDLAGWQRGHGRLVDAEKTYRRVLALQSERGLANHSDLALTHNDLGVVLTELGRYADAVKAFAEAKRLWETRWDGPLPTEDFAVTLHNYAVVLEMTGRAAEASALEAQAAGIIETRRRALGL